MNGKNKALLAATGLAISQMICAEAPALSLEDAIKAALVGDERTESATWDWLAAQARAKEAEMRQLPSVTLSAGYTRQSYLESNITFAGYAIPIKSLENAFSLNANLQYPIFAGFRLQESAKLAEIQAQNKGVAAEMIKRSIVFEVQRAYWEAQRTTYNVRMLEENKAQAAQSLDIVKQQTAQGTAMRADLLTAEMRLNQADMSLGAAESAQKRAFGMLESLVSGARSESDREQTEREPEKLFILTAKPEPISDKRFETLREDELIARALVGRPETRASRLNSVAAEINRRLAEAPLYPTLSLTGTYVYADPNPRVAFQTDPAQFTGTWSVGLLLSYDLGGLPANLEARNAQIAAVQRNRADEKSQEKTVTLDVRNCLLNFEQTKRDAAFLSGMIDQAKENERVTERKTAAGTASDLDLMTARIFRMQVELSIVNKLIDMQIAAADLERAAALVPVK